MAKRKQIGVFGAIALAVASSVGGTQAATAVTPSENVRHHENKESLHVEKKAVRPVSERNKFGGFSGVANPYKSRGTDYRNQRQLRKYLRQNPSQRKKYDK